MRTFLTRLCGSVLLVVALSFAPGTGAVPRPAPATTTAPSATTTPPPTATPRTTTPTATVTPPATTAPPSLHLAVDRGGLAVGELLTLSVGYTNLGLPYTTIAISPTDVLEFDPPVAMPCKYNEHPTQCTSFTLRAKQDGAATIRAIATGEIFDDACQCWRFGSAADDGPAIVVVGGSRRYLPFVLR